MPATQYCYPYPEPIHVDEHHEVLDEASETFYNIANLPPADQHDWEKRMIYRVFLRSPYPPAIWTLETWHVLHLGLVNEMSLFPQKALQKGLKFECCASALDVTRPERALAGVEVEIKSLDAEERRWMAGVSDLHWPGFSGGRGAMSVRIVKSKDTEGVLPDRFLLKIGVVRGVVEDSLFVLPLIIGPFELTSGEAVLSGEEMLYFHRQLTLPNHESILIRESPEIAIPGKIWDSALFATRAALDMLMTTKRSPDAKLEPHVLDLSAGTGVCGIWMAVMLRYHFSKARVLLTDLDEALSVMETNITLNRHRIASNVEIEVRELRWGNSKHASGLAALDLIIACDLIYEAELLPALVETLDALTTPGKTHVIIGYKQRGLSKEEKEHLWLTLAERFEVEKMAPIMGCMERDCRSDSVGIELWKLYKKYKHVEL